MSNEPTSRFSYIGYDKASEAVSVKLRESFQDLEIILEENLKPGRPKSLVMTALEEAFMWVGKSIRDTQIARDLNDETP